MESMNEFVIEWLKGQNVASITAPSGSALKNKLIKLSKKYPDECDYFENKDGSVFGHVPVKFVKISPPKTISEETLKKLQETGFKKKSISDSDVEADTSDF